MSKNKSKVLVTGGAGFIGASLVPALLSDGFDVAVLDNLTFGRRAAVPKAARFYEYDIRHNKLGHIFALEKPEIVIHLAAQINVRYSVAHPQEDADINIIGALNVITQSRRQGVKKFVFASSGGEVYGDARQIPTPENHPTRPRCPYGITKLFGEQCLAHYGEEENLDWLALRLANVYGPRQDGTRGTGITAIFIDALLNQKPVLKIGDWQQTRDFVYIDDTIAAFSKALETDTHGWQTPERILNIGTGLETSVEKLAVMLEQMTNSRLAISQNVPEVGAPQRKALDPSLAAKLLGWVPNTALNEGLAECVEVALQSTKQ